MKRPAFMFYPADWRKDPELRVCSIAARGLWIDMLAIAHEAVPYGHLVSNGKPLTVTELARLVGEPVGIVRRLLAELERHHVFSVTEHGVLYSRRMVRDEHIREVRAAAGKLGGNPALVDKPHVKPDDKAGDKGLVNQTAKQNPTPSVSVTVAVASSKDEKPSASDDAVSRHTWLTPYADAWRGQYGGELEPGKAVKSLRKLELQYGAVETLRRWKIYLAATLAAYINVPKFAATWGSWETPINTGAPAARVHALERYRQYRQWGLINSTLQYADYEQIGARLVEEGHFSDLKAFFAEVGQTRPAKLGQVRTDREAIDQIDAGLNALAARGTEREQATA